MSLWLTIEECSLDELWCLKVDHEWVRDGEWHQLNAGSRAFYRFVDDRLVLIGPGSIEWEEFAHACGELSQILPVFESGTYEAEIHRGPGGLELVSDRFGDHRSPLRSLSREAVHEAFDAMIKQGWCTWSRERPGQP